MRDQPEKTLEVQALEKRIAYLQELARLIGALSVVTPPPSAEDEFEDWRASEPVRIVP